MKYPIGLQSFERIIKEGYVYVDKTDLVYSLVNGSPIYFLSRPRRFGKSLLVSTLENYFLGNKEVFKGLAIEKLEKEWKKYPVFHIDFNGEEFFRSNALDNKILGQLKAWEQKYNVKVSHEYSISTRFSNILEAAHGQTGLGCVVLVDEYDKPMLDVLDSNFMVEVDGNKISMEDKNRETLKAFYSTFKLADKHLRFVFLTGVTKFSQVSVFSGFNQPNDISMVEKYDTLCGITDEEIDTYFSESVAELAEKKKKSVPEMRGMLRKRFDGYHFSTRLKGVHNPFSLLSTFENQAINDYWFRTGTPTYLIRLLNHSDKKLDELTNKYYMQSQFIDYKADKEEPLPMIYQSGYLTIKGVDEDEDDPLFLLDFPNVEVKRGFVTLVGNNYLKQKEDIECTCFQLSRALKTDDLEKFRVQLTAFLASVPYEMRRKENEQERERYFQYTFYLIMRLISTYLVYTEKRQSQGRVDCVIETKSNIYIFEFKLDGTADEALQQIKEKGYATEYLADGRPIRLIGCSFSSETGTIGDWKVEV